MGLMDNEIKPAKDPLLTPTELDSSCWAKVKQYLLVELAGLRAFNDGTSLGEVETAVLRGEIKRIKKMLRAFAGIDADRIDSR